MNYYKMVRSSVIRNLGQFRELRRLEFGSSTGDMTVHITKGGSLYRTLCKVVHQKKIFLNF